MKKQNTAFLLCMISILCLMSCSKAPVSASIVGTWTVYKIRGIQTRNNVVIEDSTHPSFYADTLTFTQSGTYSETYNSLVISGTYTLSGNAIHESGSATTSPATLEVISLTDHDLEYHIHETFGIMVYDDYYYLSR